MSETKLISPSVENHLTKLLEQLNITDYSLDISPGSIKGDNFIGIIANVRVEGKNKTGDTTTLNLIVKSAPSNELLREIFPIHAVYEREIYMYTTVLPTLVTFQEEKHIPDSFTAFPKYFAGTLDELNEAIVMENMKTQGFKLWNRFEPLDYVHTLLVMKTYGKLHALSFALRDQKLDLFQELAANTHERVMVRENTTEQHFQQMKGFVDNALAALDHDEYREAYERVKRFQNNLLGNIQTALMAEEAGDYAVIGHGDCWINNMLFKYGNSENSNIPSDICLIDFQISRYGSPVLDLAYFIFTCTDKQLRDQHYSDLINEYYHTLSTFLQKLGSDPKKLFPYKAFQEQLQKFCIYGLFASIAVLHFMISEPDDIPDINTVQSMDELKNFAVAPKNFEKYRERVRGVVLDFIKYKYDF